MINTARGLVYIWDKNYFQSTNVLKGGRWLCAKGISLEENFVCSIGLFYSPHDISEKSSLGGFVGSKWKT